MEINDCSKCWLSGFKAGMIWAESNPKKISVDINVNTDNDSMSNLTTESMEDFFESNIVASEPPFIDESVQVPVHHISETTPEEWDIFFENFKETAGGFISKLEILKILDNYKKTNENSWRILRKQLAERGYEYHAQKIVQSNGVRIKGWVGNIEYIG